MAEEETKSSSRAAPEASDEQSGRAREGDEDAQAREGDEHVEARGGGEDAEAREADDDAQAREGDEDPEAHEDDEHTGGREENGGGDRDEQSVAAPSLGPKTTIEREPVEERLARHEQSQVDAMGLDKRRPVIGQSYGPGKARQFAVYLGFLAVVAALVVGGIILVGSLDKPVGKDVPNSAPWAKHGVKQIKPKPIQ
jgi:hypothetical protein